MKSNKLVAFAIAGLMLFAACEEKGTGDNAGKFSELSDAQNKANMEQSGMDMLDEVKAMENEPAMEANLSLANRLTGSSDEEWKSINWNNVPGFSHIMASANFEETGVKGMLKSLQLNPAEDPETIQEVYNELVGTYTWSANAEEFVFVAGGDALVFLFPSTENGTSNNAQYTVNYEGYTGANLIPEYDGDMPKKVTAVLTVDGAQVSSTSFDASYDGNGYPVSIAASNTMGGFTLAAKVSNNNNTGFVGESSFTHNGGVLLKLALDASGNWSEENIENNTEYYVWEYDEATGRYDRISVSENDNWESSEIKIQNIVTEGNASFQVMDFEIAGHVDVKGLAEKIEALDDLYDDYDYTEEEAQAEVDALNEFATLHLQYADSKELIANVEALLEVDEYSYETNWYDNEWHDTSKTVVEEYFSTVFVFVFADGSSVDAEAYFGNSMDDLFDEFFDYFESLEDSYDL